MFSLFVLAMAFYQCSIVNGWKATLWEHPDFAGAKYESEGSDCHNYVGNAFNDKASSIDTHGTCVRLYYHHSCQGDYIEVFPGSLHHRDLSNLGFQDTASSIGSCPQ
ncbi:hypothetical protein WDU94_006397 [Cyamophila willieti]